MTKKETDARLPSFISFMLGFNFHVFDVLGEFMAVATNWVS